ncbi:glycosyltransferase family 4 protein [Paucibacter sp. DJ1R-11]|nr:glycosyltransferase family 4 protein [Paucibacter sp. DJ1R-11]
MPADAARHRGHTNQHPAASFAQRLRLRQHSSDMTSLEFDDVIYSLQRFGGASSYWSEVTSRVVRDRRFQVRRGQPPAISRLLPSLTQADVFHSSHFRVPLRRSRTRVISTVHDMNFELGFVKSGIGAVFNTQERRRSYFTSDALICISESTRTELLSVYPQLQGRCEIRVIHHGLSRLPGGGVLPEPVSPQPGYVLFVGGRGGYKRFQDALHGFMLSQLHRQGFQLICTGQAFTETEQAEIQSLGLATHVQAVGNVAPATLAALYRQAHCLLYPSIHEGFGLPLIEAMDCACPVVCCNISCMPEIAGDAALLVAAEAPDAIAKALNQLLEPEVRTSKIAQGLTRSAQFSWDTSAERHMKLYLGEAD